MKLSKEHLMRVLPLAATKLDALNQCNQSQAADYRSRAHTDDELSDINRSIDE